MALGEDQLSAVVELACGHTVRVNHQEYVGALRTCLGCGGGIKQPIVKVGEYR